MNRTPKPAHQIKNRNVSVPLRDSRGEQFAVRELKMPQISLDWDTFKAAYPMRPLTGQLKEFMDHTPGTPCCVQMSHALNKSGSLIPAKSNRRWNSLIPQTGSLYYLLAVDEMDWFLTQNYGVGEEISKNDDGSRRSTADMKAALSGRTGILVFREGGFGKHTEIWDVDHMHQRDMSQDLFLVPKVLFWDVMITATA
jgi:hypothetical protein